MTVAEGSDIGTIVQEMQLTDVFSTGPYSITLYKGKDISCSLIVHCMVTRSLSQYYLARLAQLVLGQASLAFRSLPD